MTQASPVTDASPGRHPSGGDDVACHAGLAAVSRSLRVAFALLGLFMAGLVLWYLTFGGYFTVGPQENVLVLRFGRLVAAHREGWHWVFPQPVHEIVRIPTSQRTVATLAFWPARQVSIMEDEGAPREAPLKPGVDGYLLTGDANIVHTAWTMNYQVTDPQAYYLRFLCPADPRKPDEILRQDGTGAALGPRGPETQLRHLLETAVLHEAAVRQVDAALYQDAKAFNDAVAARLGRMVADRRLGIAVTSVVLTEKLPPAATMAAFQQVVSAMQESQNAILQARRYATRTQGRARARAAQLRAEAETYRKRVVSDVTAEGIYFGRILAEFRANPATVLFALYTDTLATVLDQATDKFIVRTNEAGRQEVRVQINPEPAKPRPAAPGEGNDE